MPLNSANEMTTYRAANPRGWLHAVAVGALFVGSPVWSQAPLPSSSGNDARLTVVAPPHLPGPLNDSTLTKLIDESLASRPELAEANADVRAQSEVAPQVDSPADPMLQLGIQNDGFTSWEIGKAETSFYSILLSQTFPWPGKLGLRRDIAELGTGQAKTAATRALLSAVADVRRAYLDLILARDRLALLDALERLWQESAGIARTRYEVGDAAQSDVLQSQLELNRLKQRRWALQAEASISLQMLNRLRSHPLEEPIDTSIHLRDLGAPQIPELEPAVEDALERSPELGASRLGIGASEKSVSLAQKSYFPDFTVSAGIMPRGGSFPPMWLVSVGVPLPIFAGSKQSRAVAEAEARTVAAHSRAEAIEQVLRLRVYERRTALTALTENIRLYQEGLLIQSEATAASTLAQYKVGKVSFASVLQANAGYIADQDGYLQSLAAGQRILIASAEVSLDPVAISNGGLTGSAMPGQGSTGGGAPQGMTTAAPGPLGGPASGSESRPSGM